MPIMFKDSQGMAMFQHKLSALSTCLLKFFTTALLGLMIALCLPVHAASQAPDVFMQQLSNELMEVVRKDPAVKAGDMQKLANLVDSRVLPNVNFQRMTASAVGPAWRQASPEQQKRLQEEFKMLLVRSYAGALSQAKESHNIVVKGFKGSAEDNEVLVRSESEVAARQFLWTIAWKKVPMHQAVGRSITLIYWVCGWSITTAPSLHRKSTPKAWTA